VKGIGGRWEMSLNLLDPGGAGVIGSHIIERVPCNRHEKLGRRRADTTAVRSLVVWQRSFGRSGRRPFDVA
jgi:hypothetical protein